MKLAMVSEHASPLAALGGADAGGQNVHVGALAEELVRQGHTVVVHTRRDHPDLRARVRTAAGVVVHHVDAGPPLPIPKDQLRPWMEDFGRVLQSEWEKDRPDVVHAHFWMSGLAALQAARPLGLPAVQTFHALGAVKRRHQGPADTSPADRLAVEELLITHMDQIVATCSDEADELVGLGADPEQVRIIPCGVDLSLFQPGGARQPPRSLPHRLVVIGRLVERKGVADVIESLTWLPGTELLVAGGPPAAGLDGDADVRRLRKVADHHGVSGRVRFLGQVSRHQLPAVIRSADAVVSVPAYEPFGMVALEAMACGVPVVVSAVGGLRESVVDGRTGLHVPPGRPRLLAEVLGRLLDDPPLVSGLGSAGVRRARSRFGWGGIARATAGLYQEVQDRVALSSRAAAR
ncbi:MAG: glycosyltransferase [Acidimicrobiales bacterium]